eukprot:evm.model.scf_4531.1 EVM.evm.TU.scf_4531.1   scf_4531:3189-4082(+)
MARLAVLVLEMWEKAMPFDTDVARYFDRLLGRAEGDVRAVMLLGEGDFSFSSVLVRHYKSAHPRKPRKLAFSMTCFSERHFRSDFYVNNITLLLGYSLAVAMGCQMHVASIVGMFLCWLRTWIVPERIETLKEICFLPTTVESRWTVQRSYRGAAEQLKYLATQDCISGPAFGINATIRLPEREITWKFDRIVFNFPSIGNTTWGLRRAHRAFLNDVLSVCQTLVAPGGEIWLTLCNNQDVQWCLAEQAEGNALQVAEVLNFPLLELEKLGYVRVRGSGAGADFPSRSNRTYILKSK